MDIAFHIQSFTHEDLVNLFSTATYGMQEYLVIHTPSECQHLKSDQDQCREDTWASVLLNGGHLDVLDMAGMVVLAKDAFTEIDFYGKEGTNWESHYEHLEDHEYVWGGNKVYWKIPVYRISLQTLIKGLNNGDTTHTWKLLFQLLGEESGDCYTAYNLMQIAVFGEEIYG